MLFLRNQNVLYKNQFEFKKKNSTAHTIISLIENIETEIDNILFVSEIFIDLQKAFDTVNHDILVHKLFHCSMIDIVNCWFSSYLSSRKQFVTINDLMILTQKWKV